MKTGRESSLRTERQKLDAEASPVQRTRSIAKITEVLLSVRAGGRCEFVGCNKFLFEHPLTRRKGNFSEKAHIVAFSADGPRGKTAPRPKDIHSIENLMFLCKDCHNEIDLHPTNYPKAVLLQYKHAHEKRIHHLTGLGPDQRTFVVQLTSRIAGDAVDIPAPDIYSAISPRYPAQTEGLIIDLREFKSDDVDEYYRMAQIEIRRETKKLYDPQLDVEPAQHISLFAIAQIPVLVFLGRCLSNKIAVDFFQRHRTEQNPWKWPEDGELAQYELLLVQKGSDTSSVALKLSLSGPITNEKLPTSVDEKFSIYEITLKNMPPGTDFLRKRSDLEAFRRLYREMLAQIRGKHPTAEVIYVFPAVPAPIAVSCGYDLLPKVDPALLIYDFVKDLGGFIKRIEVNDNGPQ